MASPEDKPDVGVTNAMHLHELQEALHQQPSSTPSTGVHNIAATIDRRESGSDVDAEGLRRVTTQLDSLQLDSSTLRADSSQVRITLHRVENDTKTETAQMHGAIKRLEEDVDAVQRTTSDMKSDIASLKGAVDQSLLLLHEIVARLDGPGTRSINTPGPSQPNLICSWGRKGGLAPLGNRMLEIELVRS